MPAPCAIRIDELPIIQCQCIDLYLVIFAGKQGKHAWNAVYVDGAWRLVDCHWAARRIIRNKVNPENLKYELDEYYFMPDPDQMIYSHFPDDSSLSLRDEPMTLADFEDLVFLKPSFFKHGLRLTRSEDEDAVINTKEPELELKIGLPPNLDAKATSFKFTLEMMDSSVDHYKGMPLTRFGMQETVGHEAKFKFRLPTNGSYLLTLYVKNTPDKNGGSPGMTHSSICEYLVQLDCENPPVNPFPPCIYTNWGPSENALKYSLVPLHDGAVIYTEDGKAEIRLELSKDLNFLTKLKSNHVDEHVLLRYVMHRIVGDKAVFSVTPPSVGEYGLEIYCRDPVTDGNTLYNACQYLIVCEEAKEAPSPLPVLPSNYLGAQSDYKKLGLTLLGDPDPYVHCDEPKREVIFKLSKPLIVLSQLIHVQDENTQDFSHYVLQQVKDDKLILNLRMPKPGLYKHQIYAIAEGDPSDNLPCIYNFLVNCHESSEDIQPFPKQYSQFKDSCVLYEPLEGHLRPSPEGDSVRFKVEVPRAQEVAVVVDGRWTYLKRVEEETSIWQGDVDLAKYWGKEAKLVVCANYDKSQTTYSTLLDYSV